MKWLAAIREHFQQPALPVSLLDIPLLVFPGGDAFTLRDAATGCVIFGQPGSGKSSGPGKALALRFLEAGMGGLVLCAKPNEAAKWLAYAQATGRTADIVRFSPEHPELRFNPLAHELHRQGRGGGFIHNVTALFRYLLEISEGGKSESRQDPFWDRAVTELVTYCTDVLHLAGERVSLSQIYRVVQSIPERDGTHDEFESEEWRARSYCFGCLARASAAELSPERREDLTMAAGFLLEEFPRMSGRTRSSVLATLRGMILPFLRSPLREVFGSDTTLRLEDAFEGAVILVDYPLREFGEVGRVIAGILKYFYMAAVERRQVEPNTLPSFLFVDECQEFLSAYDARFLATARESRCASVLISQNISGFYAALQTPSAKAVVDALLANCGTKIFCANSDAVTNAWAAETIAQSWQGKSQASTQVGGESQTGVSIAQQLAWTVLPGEFTKLQQGGPPQWVVQTILCQGGRQFANTGGPYARMQFSQQPII